MAFLFSVPFYVVLDSDGDIVQMGSKKNIDFDNLPGMVQPEVIEEEKKEEDRGDNFAILDLDF